MPKTIMAPSQKVLSLGIILLLASHLGDTVPPPASDRDEQTTNKVDSQTTANKDGDTAQEQEQVTSKLFSIQKALNSIHS